LLARGDDVAYRASAMRYLTMAKSLGFEGHIATAEAMQMSQGVRCDGSVDRVPVVWLGAPRGLRFCDACAHDWWHRSNAPEYKQCDSVIRRRGALAWTSPLPSISNGLREIMTELLERSAAVVHRYGGTVEHTGDGVMALFGAPSSVRRSRFSRVRGRLEHPGGGDPIGRRGDSH
jgi:hypothetical protein